MLQCKQLLNQAINSLRRNTVCLVNLCSLNTLNLNPEQWECSLDMVCRLQRLLSLNLNREWLNHQLKHRPVECNNLCSQEWLSLIPASANLPQEFNNLNRE